MRSTRPTRRSAPHAALALCAAVALICGPGAARAQDASSWREIETRSNFGSTTGLGPKGEKPITVDSVGRPGKRSGHYAATETKYEFTPSPFVQIAFGALGSIHDIGRMTDLDRRNQAAFAGGFAGFRYLTVERTSNNPLPVALAMEPTARFIDETNSARLRIYEFETIVNFDLAHSRRG